MQSRQGLKKVAPDGSPGKGVMNQIVNPVRMTQIALIINPTDIVHHIQSHYLLKIQHILPQKISPYDALPGRKCN